MNRSIKQILTGNILIFALTDLMGNFVRSAVFPYASLYILALGGSATEIGFINTLKLLAGIFMLPIAGTITDRANRVYLIAASGILSSFFLVMIVMAGSWQVVALASLLFGSIVFQFPAYASLVADSLEPEDRGRGIGIMNMISSSLAILAPFAAGYILERFSTNLGMRILYGLMLAVYLMGSVLQLRFLKEPFPESRKGVPLRTVLTGLMESYGSIPKIFRNMSVPLKALAGVILLSFSANGVSTAFWVVYATEEIGLTPTQWGLILMIEAVVRMLSFLPAGWIADRWGRTRTLILSLTVSTIALPLFIIVTDFGAILLIRMVIAATFGLAIPACTALMADLTPRRERGKIMAAIGQGGIMIHPAGGGVGGPALGYLFIPVVMAATLAGGWLYSINPVYPWLFSTVVSLLSILVALKYIRDPEQVEL